MKYWSRACCAVPWLLASCARVDTGTAPRADASPRATASSAPGTPPHSADPRAARRAACGYHRGALPRDTLDSGARLGDRIPIDHFVIVMQENRSFDHYFQKLPEYGQPDADVAPPSYECADPSGQGAMVHPFLQDDPCVEDVPHNWIAVHHQVGDGRMGGFLSAANPEGRRALGYYDATTLGYYYELAKTFAIGDRYFASVPGPTFPNRMFFLSGSSFGHAVNTAPPPRDEERTLFHQLEEKGLPWIVYSEGRTYEEQMFPRLHAEKGSHFRHVSELARDAADGKLPFFAWVESSHGGRSATDEHAPTDVQLGQAFVARVVTSVTSSPAWQRTALFLTYDEHGGFFDHVVPPAACPPDDMPPLVAGLHGARFDHLGIRVPLVLVSPYARAHHVSHRAYSHTSLLRLVQARADLPALTDRDANDEPPYDLFDFDSSPFSAPPRLPEAVIDASARKRCLERGAAPESPLDARGGRSGS